MGGVKSQGRQLNRPEGGEWKKAMCRQCGNKVWCTLEVLVKDGIIVKVQGDPENPISQGRVCARGSAMIMNVYNPYRVKSPLKRTNPKKGFDEDPGWVEISWDEALSIVAERLREIRAKDPRRFAHIWGFPGYAWVVQDEAFLPAFGTPNQLRSHGCLCPVHFGAAMVQGSFLDKQDVEYCNYLLTIGGTLGPNIGSAHNTRALARARERGMRLVVVDPRCSPEASMADEWVPIRPGTDLAFSLAMLNVMINEIGVFDEVFLKRRTNAVYLIAEDGFYLKDTVSGKPLVWDPVDGRAKAFDDPMIKDFALTGTYYVDGRKGTTAFDLVRQAVRGYTPEWAEEITTVPASTIRRIAREFVDAAKIGATITLDDFEFPYRPVAIKSERGALAKKGGGYQHLAAKMIAELVGALDVPGSYLASEFGPTLSPGPDGVVEPKSEARIRPFEYLGSLDMREFYPHRHTSPYLAWRAILDPQKYGIDYEVDALMVYAANPIMSNVNPDEVIAALHKIPFVVTISLIFDEMTDFADIVLPESAMPERYAMLRFGHHIVQAADDPMLRVQGVLVQKPIIKPLYNTRQGDDIYLEIADRVGFVYGPGGLNDHLNRTLELTGRYQLELDRRYAVPEIIDKVLRCHFGDDHGLDYFDHHAVYAPMVSKKEAYKYYLNPPGTTRHPFYFERLLFSGQQLKKALAEHGLTIPGQDMEEVWKSYEPIPRWIERPDWHARETHDLIAIVWSTPQHRMDSADQYGNAWVNELCAYSDPYELFILMNPTTAERKGLRDGDEVVVEAWHGGKTRGRLKLTELMHPDAVGFPSKHGYYSSHRNPVMRQGPHFNCLLTGQESAIDPVSCGVDLSPRVRVYRVGEVS